MKNILEDMVLFAAVVSAYFIDRLALLFVFGAQESAPTLSWYLMSLRFDIMTAIYTILPMAVLSIVSLFVPLRFAFARRLYFCAAIFVTTLICVVNFCFFSEYNSQFNFWIFGIFLDDFGSIFAVMWKDYPLLWILFSSIVFACVLWKLSGALQRRTNSAGGKSGRPIWASVAIACVYAFLLVLFIRGGKLGGRPLQFRDTAVEPSEFLNNIIPTPAFCLKQEITRFIDSAASKIQRGELDSYCSEIFGVKYGDLDVALTRRAKGGAFAKNPSRIFFIVGEGHSAWPTYDRFSSMGIMPRTRALYDKSFHCKSALSSGGGTMSSISSLISGLPYDGMVLLGVGPYTYSFSLPNLAKRLGYDSVFYYAGQSSWMMLGQLASFNGFKVVGGESMGDVYGTVEWGIRDKDMFEYISAQDIPENTLCMILTVSNHPPFDVDLKAEGCPAELKNENDVKLYHMWYADSQIGKFIDSIRAKYPDSLFVITGDHSARTIPENAKMTYNELACVPVIFAGKPVEDAGLGGRSVAQAQHLDIIATLAEMLAPKGFEYKAWGCNLLESPRARLPLTPVNCMVDGIVVPYNSADCPPELREYARKYFDLAHDRAQVIEKKTH